MNNHEKYNFAVNFKVDHFKNHPKYPDFRKYMDKQLIVRCGFGCDAIDADGDTNTIILRSFEEIEQWLDGKAGLYFKPEERENSAILVLEAVERICAKHTGGA